MTGEKKIPVSVRVQVFLEILKKIKVFGSFGHHKIIIRKSVLNIRRASKFRSGSFFEFFRPIFLHRLDDFCVEEVRHVRRYKTC